MAASVAVQLDGDGSGSGVIIAQHGSDYAVLTNNR